MRPFRALAILVLATTVAACGGAPGSEDGGADSSRAPGSSGGEPPATPGAAQSVGPAPSDGGSAVGDDCAERQSASRDAATELSLTWESINYQVIDDAGWQDQVAKGWVDASAYRAAAELLQDVPDYDDDSDRGVWSTYSADALALAALLDQAASSGTPYADDIGQQIRDQAGDLQFGAGTLVHFTVDHMCDDPADDLPAAGVEDLLAVLTPPNATETNRNTGPTFSTFEFESTDAIDSLRAHYEDTFADADLEVFWTSTYRESGTYWDINLPDGRRLTVDVNPSESGSGTTVGLSFYGES